MAIIDPCIHGNVLTACPICMKDSKPFGTNATYGCKTHPDAPHGFDRNASLNEDRYVCECEFWEPPFEQTMDDKYGDGSDHIVCLVCGLCIDCSDCERYGCKTKGNNDES